MSAVPVKVSAPVRYVFRGLVLEVRTTPKTGFVGLRLMVRDSVQVGRWGEYPDDYRATADEGGVNVRSRHGGGELTLPPQLVNETSHTMFETTHVLRSLGITVNDLSQVPA